MRMANAEGQGDDPEHPGAGLLALGGKGKEEEDEALFLGEEESMAAAEEDGVAAEQTAAFQETMGGAAFANGGTGDGALDELGLFM